MYNSYRMYAKYGIICSILQLDFQEARIRRLGLIPFYVRADNPYAKDDFGYAI